MPETQYDVFISYASEDREYARQLAEGLRANGLRVWIDNDELRVGYDLNAVISFGLTNSRHILALLSGHSLTKVWPREELSAFITYTKRTGVDNILPVIHEVDELAAWKVFPVLMNKKYVKSSSGLETVVAELVFAVTGRRPPRSFQPAAIPPSAAAPPAPTWPVAQTLPHRERHPNLLDSGNQGRWRAAPTLIVGLGGTGAKVLTRVRERFFSWIGPMEDYPVVRYLWLDTATVMAEPASPWYRQHPGIAEALKFQEHEKIALTVADPTACLAHPSDLPHIKRWLTPDLPGRNAIVDGTQQIRPYGRLAFFHHVGKIRSQLEAAVRDITSIDARRRSSANGLGVSEGKLNVIIVSSMAGGTGSGMVIDLGYLIRSVLRDRPTQLLAYLLLPGVFGSPSQVPRLYANGYAALKELNHFSYPLGGAPRISSRRDHAADHDYIQWFEAQDVPESIPGAPFELCYLIDGRNQSGVTASGPPDNETVFSLISESVLYEFVHSDFGTARQSGRDNLVYWMLGQAHPQCEPEGSDLKLPKRYSAVGLATITFPLERVRRACSAKLASDIVASWLGSSGNDISAPDDLKHRFLKLVEALVVTDPERTGNRDITAWAHANIGSLRDRDPSGESWLQTITEKIADFSQAWAGATTTDSARWGENVKAMRRSQANSLKHLRATLDEQVMALITVENLGIDSAMEVLAKLAGSDGMNGYMAAWGRERELAHSEADATRMILEHHLTDLSEQRHMTRWTGLRRVTMQATLKKIEEEAIAHYLAQVRALTRRLAMDAGAAVLQWLSRDDPEGWLYRLAALKGRVTDLKSRLDERVEAYSAPISDHRHIVLYSGPDDLMSIYRRYVPEPEEAVRALSGRALQSLVPPRAEQSERACDVGDDCNRLMRVAAQRFAYLSDDYNAFDLFHGQYPIGSPEWRAKISELIAAGQPWISWDGGQMRAVDAIGPEQFKFILGLPVDRDDRRFTAFTDGVTNLVSASRRSVQVAHSGSPHEIVFFCEAAGYALCQASSIQAMREQYLKLIAQGARDLHTDRYANRFSELAAPGREEKQKLDSATLSFLIGSILGVIRPVLVQDGPGSEAIAYEYPSGTGGFRLGAASLGTEEEVVNCLRFRSDSILAQISEEIYRLRARVREDQGFRANYAAILSYWLNYYFSPRRVEIGHGIVETLRTTESRVLEDELRMVMDETTPEWQQALRLRLKQIGTDQDDFTVTGLDGRRVLRMEPRVP